MKENHKIETKIICGFPGIGKSGLFEFNETCNSSLTITDSNSTEYAWVGNERNPDFPNNYIKSIKENIGKIDIILVSSHRIVREELRKANINYYLVYPDASLKEEYIERYHVRGSSEKFIESIDNNLEEYLEEIRADNYPIKIKLSAGLYLTDVLGTILDTEMCSNN